MFFFVNILCWLRRRKIVNYIKHSTRNWSIQTSSTWLLQWVWSAGKYVHPRSVRSKISSRGWCLGPDSVIQASSVVLSCPVTEVAVLAPTLCSGLQWEENTAAGRSLGSYNRKFSQSLQDIIQLSTSSVQWHKYFKHFSGCLKVVLNGWFTSYLVRKCCCQIKLRDSRMFVFISLHINDQNKNKLYNQNFFNI